MKNKYHLAILEAFLSTSLWGFGFIATKWAMMSVGPMWVNSLRMLLGFGIGLSILFLMRRITISKIKSLGLMAFFPGFFLGSTLVLQTVGLKYTSVTNNGFITVLYVVFVPILQKLFFKKSIHKMHILYVAIALLGAALMCGFTAEGINKGDVYTLLCAFIAAFHILSIDYVSGKIKSAFEFNVFQSFWAGFLTLLLAVPLDERLTFPFHPLATFGILFLTIGSTLIAFMCQIRSQKILPASTVSMLFLLESPFASFFAYIILGETLTNSQWVGGALILLSAYLVARYGKEKTEKIIIDQYYS